MLSVKGFAATRLAEVAEAAQLQTATIYYYFPSRDDLIEEVIYGGISEMRRHLEQTLDDLPPGTPSVDKILAAVETHLRHELELSDYATASIRNARQIPEHLRLRQKQEELAYNRIWEQLISAAIADGEFRNDVDPEIARLLMMGALNWAAEWWSPSSGAVDVVVNAIRTIMRGGLTPQTSS